MKGYGFNGENPENNVLTIDKTPCNLKYTEGTYSFLYPGQTDQQIYCLLEEQVTGDQAKLAYSGNGTQINPYHWGAGLEYVRFRHTGDFTSMISTARADSMASENVYERSIKTDIVAGNVFGTYYGQYYKGYFVAQNDGVHIFRAWADDRVAVYLNTEAGTGEIPSDMEPILRTSNPQSFNGYYNKVV